MTSKNLFFNMMKEELKQKIWIIASTILMLFFAFPIYTLLLLEGSYDMDSIRRVFTDGVTLDNPWIMIVTLIIAFFFAMQGFSYLHSKKQIDLYHGIPVKREMLFAVKYVSGVVLYLIPLVIFSSISMAIFAVKGAPVFGKPFLPTFFQMLIVTVVFYLLTYTVMIIGVLLTGNKVISVFSILSIMVYGPVLYATWQFMASEFWVTQYRSDNMWSIVKWTSPLSSYLMTVMEAIVTQNTGSIPMVIVPVIVFTLLLLALAVVLHKKRSSESAGQAIAFPILKPILKILLVTPFSLMGGIFFSMFSYRSGITWYIFGVVLSFLLGNALIEVVFAFDIRKAFSHKKIWLCNAILIIAVNLFFIMDIGGYDTYLPKQGNIESMAVQFDYPESNVGNRDNYYTDQDGNYINMTELKLDTMEIKDFAELYRLTGKQADYIKSTGRMQLIRSNGIREGNINPGSMIIRYNLKGGKKAYRTYGIDFQEDAAAITKIYETPEYLSAAYGISGKERYNEAYYTTQYQRQGGRTQLPMKTEEVAELARLYQEDMVNLKLDLKKEMLPIGTITLVNKEYGGYRNFYLYPFCEKTIAYMQQATGGNLLVDEKIEAKNVIIAQAALSSDTDLINNYYYDGYYNSYQYDAAAREGTQSWNITDESLIQRILEEGILLEYMYGNPYLKQSIDQYLTVTVDYYSDNFGNKGSVNFCFPNGELPEAIKVTKTQE